MTVQLRQHYETLKIVREPGVVRVTIDRPEVLNALNATVLAELTDVVETLAADQSTRALVIGSAGDKAFVAGADIAAMRDMAPSEALEFSRTGHRLTLALERAPFVTIARVQGFALGGGCELAMACDLVIAARRAKFGQPEVDLGLIPGFGGTQRLARRVGPAVAMDMLCGGLKLTGEEAWQLGLVSRVVDGEALDETVNLVVKAILKAAPDAIAETKKLTRASAHLPLEHGLEAEATAFAARFAAETSKEGLNAFLDKRKPNFSL